MTTLVRSVTDVYDEYMASGDPRVTKWFLMESPGPTFALVFAYVLFVKKIGPAWMMDRKPYDLRYPMFLYNAVLVLTNFYLILETFRILLKPSHSWFCRVDDKNDPDAIRLAELGWWFYFIKFIEFADTIFFVLRKKNKHISTLHVVHHATVPIAVWGGLRIEPGSYNYFFPLINTIVHTVMYSYYGLAALGPSVQKYLWWKKYLTTFQMIQFVMVFFYAMTLMLINCQVSKFIIYLNTSLAGLFLVMFYDYFQNTYLKKRAIRKQKDIDAANGQSSSPNTDNGPSASQTMSGPSASQTMSGPSPSQTMSGPSASLTMKGPSLAMNGQSRNGHATLLQNGHCLEEKTKAL